jgi:hypothetical protein
MAIRDDFEEVAGQVRLVLHRFALVVLVVMAFAAMLIGKADTVLVENARVLALDLASPALEAIARPVAVANRTIADLKEFATLREENARLREENTRLLACRRRRGGSRTRTPACASSPTSARGRRRRSSQRASSATASAPMCAARCSMSAARPA